MNRRRFLKSAILAAVSPAVLPLIDGPAVGQPSWPTRNLKMIVPFPPGGQADFAARPMAAALEKIFGHAVVVENRAAGGSSGNAIVARAAPDGYTVLMTVSSFPVLSTCTDPSGPDPTCRTNLRSLAVNSGFR